MRLLEGYQLRLARATNQLLTGERRVTDECLERALDAGPEIDYVGGEIFRIACSFEVRENGADAIQRGERGLRALRTHLRMRKSPASARRRMKLSASCSGFGVSDRQLASRILSTISSHVPSNVLPSSRLMLWDSGVDLTSAKLGS